MERHKEGCDETRMAVPDAALPDAAPPSGSAGGSLYRIHGSNEPQTIGQAVSSGCIRMTNEDVVDLYDRVRVGTRVVVLR
jgi:L,D-transpeptidase catalytic domain